MHLCPIIALCNWSDSNEKAKEDFVHLKTWKNIYEKNIEPNWARNPQYREHECIFKPRFK